jgi:hypothetical protein
VAFGLKISTTRAPYERAWAAMARALAMYRRVFPPTGPTTTTTFGATGRAADAAIGSVAPSLSPGDAVGAVDGAGEVPAGASSAGSGEMEGVGEAEGVCDGAGEAEGVGDASLVTVVVALVREDGAMAAPALGGVAPSAPAAIARATTRAIGIVRNRWMDALWAPLLGTGNSRASSLPEHRAVAR